MTIKDAVFLPLLNTTLLSEHLQKSDYVNSYTPTDSFLKLLTDCPPGQVYDNVTQKCKPAPVHYTPAAPRMTFSFSPRRR